MRKHTNRILIFLLACAILFSAAACRVQPVGAPEPAANVQPPSAVATPGVPETPEEEYIPEGEMISAEELANSLREKYADDETMEIREVLWSVPEDKEFSADFAFDLIEDTELTEYTQVFAVYADAELTEAVSTVWEIVTHEDDPSIPEGHNRVYARPGRFTPGRVWGSFSDLITYELIELDESGDYYLHEKEEFTSWGFLQQYYLAQHIDPVTAETLEKPLVTIFTIENKLDAPHSEFYVTADGKAAFRWNEVPGADYYLIVEINEFAMISPIDKATGTSWEYPHRGDPSLMNQKFRGPIVTDDEMVIMPDDFERREADYKNYSVIAVNSEVHSPLGNIHRGEELATRLPRSLAWHTIRQDAEETGGNTIHIPSIGLLPTHRAISMADGTTVQRRMIYDFSFAEVKADRWLQADGYDEDGNFINPIFYDRTNLHINYVIEGTLFADRIIVLDVDPDTALQELEEFRQINEDNAPRGGGSTETGLDRPTKKPDSKTSDDAPDQILDQTSINVFANSALSEFLALNMLAANEMIDLSAFPESASWDHLLDAFLEAMYQNPLILHVESAASIPGTNLLVVEYGESARKIHEQQVMIRAIVPRIVSQIITPGMTDLEKSFAINDYLIENSEYDWAALEDAERNNFQTVDARFNDSFTAYGILINKVGVCAGYAAAYKLLADEAGLDAIVVTGFMEGVLPHAWNRVNIDGHWHTVDVTNNANEFLLNAFMHLPDTAAGRVLVEDNAFMMNAFLSGYRSNDNNSEYYNVTGRLFDKDEVAVELARLIRQNGSATLRTNYDLNDDEFYDIAMTVLDILNINDLFGFYMLGVIWMSDSA